MCVDRRRGAGRALRWPHAGVAASVACLMLAPAVAQAARVAPDQSIATMLSAHTVRSAPNDGAKAVGAVAARRPITGGSTVLPVLKQVVDKRGRFWLRVRLPGRTLSRRPPPAGWISATSTKLSSTALHIVVDVRARRVVVYDGAVKTKSFPAIVGKRATPTPRGEYFVEETMSLQPSHSGAPFALALSARSNVLQEFEGGPGQIAIHGIANVGGTLGSAVSHGCVRVSTADVTWLATTIDAGVPVSIV
jgi:lipoprotein-anchoring transpeptidase ErfK/SrfK